MDFAFHRSQHGHVIRFGGYFRDILDIGDFIFCIHNKNGPGQQRQLLDQYAIGESEAAILIIREGCNPLNSGSSAPVFLGKRKIPADGQNNNPVRQLRGLLIKPANFSVADRGIEGGNGADDLGLALVISE